MADHILVPIDGSPLSIRALRHTLETYPDATITVLHVTDLFDPDRRSAGEYEPLAGSAEWYEMAQEASEDLLTEASTVAEDHGRSIETESELGDPERVIPDYARDHDIDHTVLGVHGRDEAERSLVGRVAESVVYRSPSSVTIIR